MISISRGYVGIITSTANRSKMTLTPYSSSIFTLVDKILKGRMPADPPVEQPMKFEFIVNLIAAKQIGFTVPPNVLVRADRVIR